MNVELIDHNSDKYWQLVKLRSNILRIPLGLEFSETELKAERKQLHFGIFKGSKALACMVLVPQLNGYIKMRQVCVDQEFQGKKLGSNILKHCENYARIQGYRQICYNAREAAEAFYLLKGYVIVGEKFLEVGIPHYYMEKNL